MSGLELRGRKVLVTGATKGIGRALADLLAVEGAHLLATGRHEGDLGVLRSAYPGQVATFQADLSDPSHVDALLDHMRRDHPDISVLINNAGVQHALNLLGGDAEENAALASQEIAVNFDAVIALTIGILQLLRQHQSAAIVNVTSALAIAPKKSAPVYCATKAGLRAFTKALRYQCEDEAPGLLVMDAMMGLVDTGMTVGRGKGKVSPGFAAAQIIDGLKAGRADLAVAQAKSLKRVARLSPRLAERILRNS